MKKMLVCLVVVAFLVAGCVGFNNNVPSAPTGLKNLNSIWDEIYAISQTGELNNLGSFKLITFEDGSEFYFGSSPVDNSIGLLMTLPECPTIGIAIVMVNGKASEAQKIFLTPFGPMAELCDLAEAEEIAKDMLKEYQTRLGTIKQIPIGGTNI